MKPLASVGCGMNLKTLSVPDAIAATGMPQTAIYRLIKEGAVTANRIGRRWRISEASLEAWVTKRAARQQLVPVRVFPDIKDRFA